MNEIMKRVATLISVKSIVTLVLTGAFAYLSITGTPSEAFMSVYLTVVAFYFGTQYQKNKDTIEGGESTK